MKITVVGSYDDVLQKRNYDEKLTQAKNEINQARTRKCFENACIAIGEALAKGMHRLIVAHGERSETAEALALKGFQKASGGQVNRFDHETCFQHHDDAKLKAHLDAVEMSDAVILIGGADGTYASGLSALRRRKVMIPITVFGGSAKDLCSIKEIKKTLVDPIRNLDLMSADWIKTLTDEISRVLSEFPRVLIIHGRGDSGKELQKRIADESRKNKNLHGVAEPQIMDLKGRGADSVPEVFEELASEVSAAIVIVTADDIGGSAKTSEKADDIGSSPKSGEIKIVDVAARDLKLKPRARENVWVEVGWFWGRLGRERIFLWRKDEVELPSDLQGAAGTNEHSLENAWESISSFLTKLRGTDRRWTPGP